MKIHTLVTLALIAVSSTAAAGPVCAPDEIGIHYNGTSAKVGYSRNGYWAVHSCIPTAAGLVLGKKENRVVILTAISYGTLASIAGKVSTAMQSPASFQTSWKRHVTLPWNSPLLDAVRADFLRQYPNFVPVNPGVVL